MTIRNIQVLRALAALLVVCVHFGNEHGFERRYLGTVHPLTEVFSRFGYIGVDLFFIISGFIMVITTFRANGTHLSAAEFLKRRCLRIYPPLWIVNTLVLVVFLVKPSLVNSHGGAPTDVLASYLLLPQPGNALVLVAWTLVYEMLFYLVFALGLLGGVRATALTLGAWALAIAAAQYLDPAPSNVYLALVQNPIVCEFLLGTLVAVAVRKNIPERVAFTLGIAGGVGAIAVCVAVAMGLVPFPDGWYRVAAAVPVACFVLGAVAAERRFGAWTLPALEHLGDASYALYLWHIPTLTVVGIALHALHPRTPLVQAVCLAFALAAVIGVAMLVYRCIEAPVTEYLRRKFSSPKRA